MSSAVSPTEPSETLRCARHPSTETVLRCGRCDTPICNRCMVMSPVGARCPACAQVKRFNLMLKPAEVARSVVFGLLVAAIGAVVLSFIPFLGIVGQAALGFGVGEVVSVGAHRKRVPMLAPLAVACLFVGYALGVAAPLIFGGFPIALAFALALRSFQGLAILGLLVGALLAWMRNR
jgi:uncharacterized membrane protein